MCTLFLVACLLRFVSSVPNLSGLTITSIVVLRDGLFTIAALRLYSGDIVFCVALFPYPFFVVPWDLCATVAG